MEEKALRGLPWTLMSYAVQKVITLGTTVALARLLVPADFGLLALSLLVIEALNYVSGTGLSQALVIRHDVSARDRGSFLSLMLVLGVATGALLLLLAPLLADAFKQERLSSLLPALAALLPLGALTSFYTAILQHELEFFRRFASQLAHYVTYAVVSLALAASGAGVWSLVAGQLAGAGAYALAIIALAPYHVRPALDLRAARSLSGTGAGFVLQGTAAFLEENVDYAAVGRLVGSTGLGLYSMSYRLSELPYWAVTDPVAQVILPGFARMRARGEEVKPAFLGALRMVALASAPAGLLLAACADPLTHVAFGSRWAPMVGALSVLGIWGAIRPSQSMFGWLLNALGQASLAGTLAMVSAIALLPLMLLAADRGGITAVAWVVLGGTLVWSGIYSAIARHRLNISLTEQWSALRPVILAGAPTWAAAWGVAHLLDQLGSGVALLGSLVAGVAIYVGALAIAEPGLPQRALRDGRRLALGMGRRTEPAEAGPAVVVPTAVVPGAEAPSPGVQPPV